MALDDFDELGVVWIEDWVVWLSAEGLAEGPTVTLGLDVVLGDAAGVGDGDG